MASVAPHEDADPFLGRLDSSDDSEDENEDKGKSKEKVDNVVNKTGDEDEEDGEDKVTKRVDDNQDDEEDDEDKITKRVVDHQEEDEEDDDEDRIIKRVIDDEDEEDDEDKVTKRIVCDDDEGGEEEKKDGEKDSKRTKRVKKDNNDDKDDSDEDNSDSESEGDDKNDDSEDEDREKEDNGQEKAKGDIGNNDGDEDEDDDDDDDDDDDEEEERARKRANNTVYDFDIMMAKKKEENSRKRRRYGYDISNGNDDIIAEIINQMKDAVDADIEANRNKQVATNKLKLLPFLVNQLRKVDLRDAFLDSDVLSVMTGWLAPLPDRSLPHLNIRENLLKILIDFNLYDVDRIKSSGIGKAVMYLYKHPRETKENKQRAKQLISAWSRPIFNLDSSFSAISREEREERDKELKRRASRTVDSSDGESSSQASKSVKDKDNIQQQAKNPGDKGWIPRARVPAPSMRDYVIRPRSKVDGDIGKGSKRPANMLEKLMKTHQERRRANKQQRAINMKIDKL